MSARLRISMTTPKCQRRVFVGQATRCVEPIQSSLPRITVISASRVLTIPRKNGGGITMRKHGHLHTICTGRYCAEQELISSKARWQYDKKHTADGRCLFCLSLHRDNHIHQPPNDTPLQISIVLLLGMVAKGNIKRKAKGQGIVKGEGKCLSFRFSLVPFPLDRGTPKRNPKKYMFLSAFSASGFSKDAEGLRPTGTKEARNSKQQRTFVRKSGKGVNNYEQAREKSNTVINFLYPLNGGGYN